MTTSAPPLFEHIAPGSAPAQPVYGLAVKLVEEHGEPVIIVGHVRYDLERARGLIATIAAAIKIGEHAG